MQDHAPEPQQQYHIKLKPKFYTTTTNTKGTTTQLNEAVRTKPESKQLTTDYTIGCHAMMWCLRGGGYASRHSDQLGLPENCDLVYWRREGGVRYAYQIVIVLREIPIEFFVKIYTCVELCAGVMCVRCLCGRSECCCGIQHSTAQINSQSITSKHWI